MERDMLKYSLNLQEEINNLNIEIEKLKEANENKKQMLLKLIALNIKLSAESDNNIGTSIKSEMNDLINKIMSSEILN